jgi:hypothetical protein
VLRFGGLIVAAFILIGQIVAGPAVAQPGAPRAGVSVALVIGNGKYQNVAELLNPSEDARAVSAALKRIGFSVVEGYDLNFIGMAERLKTFGRAADKASVALVFYAGHGLQMNGTNYLLPVDARVQREKDLAYDAISLDMILREAEAARDLRIIILDACRDNPFAARIARAGGPTRSIQITEGLAQVGNIGRNTLVAYATAANALADDGKDEHSPYTKALLKHLETPGLEINLLFGRIRDSVFEATAGRQTPFTYGSLGGEPFYLIPPREAQDQETSFWRALAPMPRSPSSGCSNSPNPTRRNWQPYRKCRKFRKYRQCRKCPEWPSSPCRHRPENRFRRPRSFPLKAPMEMVSL